MSEKVLVTGAGGFIGGHLIASLLEQGHDVRAVDTKPPDALVPGARRTPTTAAATCPRRRPAAKAMRGVDAVYNLAADMGGMGFIETQQGAVHAVAS